MQLVSCSTEMKMKLLRLVVLLLCTSSCIGTLKDCSKSESHRCELACCGQTEINFQPRVQFFQGGRDLLSVERAFSAPECDWNRENGKFRCKVVRNSLCKRSIHTCVVTQGPGSVYSLTFSVIVRYGGGANHTRPTCRPPVITNIRAVKQEDGNITVKWTYSRELPYPYCNKSRRFQVGVKSYNSYKIATSSSGYPDEYHDVSKKRLAEFNFTDLSVNLYHRFFVRSLKGEGNGNNYTASVRSLLQYLKESEPLALDKSKQVHYGREGHSVTLSCKASGIPVPTVTYSKSDQDNIQRLQFRKLQLDDEGDYFCKACHTYFDNRQGEEREECIKGTITLHVIPIQDRECIFYTNQPCSAYIYTDWSVFSDNTTAFHESYITEILDRSSSFSEKCAEFIESVLCHRIYPYCNPFTVEEGDFSPLQMCHQTCLELKSTCGEEIEAFGDRRLSTILLQNCTKDSSPEAGDKPGCIFVNAVHPLKDGPDVDPVRYEDQTTSCIKGNGRGYRGNQRRTIGGNFCQNWNPLRGDHLRIHDHQLDRMMGAELEAGYVYCRNPGGLGERPWCFLTDTHQRWEYCDIPKCEECMKYTGDFCTDVGYTKNTTVFFRRSVKESIKEMEVHLRGKVHAIPDDLTPGCELALLQILCYRAMPMCSGGAKQPQCTSHCQLLDLLLSCPQSVLDVIYSIEYLDLEECGNRTLHQGAPKCLPEVTFFTSPSVEEGCYNTSDYGQSYLGDVNVTSTHTPCVPWKDRLSVFSKKNFPELEGGFCRNPNQLQWQPWCFTSTNGDWGYCNVSVCVDVPVPPSSQTQRIANNDHHHQVFYIILPCVIAIFAIIAAFIGITFGAYRKTKQYKSPLDERRDATNSIYYTNPLLSPATLQMTKSFRKIDKSKIKYIKQLGQGNFGIVFQGECDRIQNNEGGGPTKVAVKTLKPESSKEDIQNFVSEAKLLHGFDHPHVVEFYGVCMEEMPYYIVFEYMDQGDLCQFLRDHSSTAQRRYNPPVFHDRRSSSSSNDSTSLGTTELLDMCKQICNGMAYLEYKNHIHRDLASRNCLVKTGMMVKIADFGMSQNLYSRDYYRVSGEACLPVRWMPPESIIYGTFSSKGDVWSFGVVVWEVFSFGMQPYWGISNDAVVEMIRRGKLLDKPDSCPDKVYELILSGCWRMYESERMSFAALDHTLKKFRLSDSNSSMASFDDEDANSDVFTPFENDDDGD